VERTPVARLRQFLAESRAISPARRLRNVIDEFAPVAEFCGRPRLKLRDSAPDLRWSAGYCCFYLTEFQCRVCLRADISAVVTAFESPFRK
jgi:hypothetical protein